MPKPSVERDLQSIAEEITRGLTIHCSFVAGSHMEGRATKNSDIDFIVVVESIDSIPKFAGRYSVGHGISVRRQLFRRGSRQIDVEYWQLSDLNDLAAEFQQIDSRPLMEFPPEVYRFIHRLDRGFVVQGQDAVSKLRELLPIDPFVKHMGQTHLFDYKSKLEDLFDWLSNGRAQSSVILSRIVLDHAIDAYLAWQQASHPNVKWRFEELKALEPCLATDYFAAVECPGENPIERRILLAGTIAACVRLRIRYQDIFRKGRSAAKSPLIRNTFSYIDHNLKAGFLLRQLPDKVYSINPSAGLVWLLADGRDAIDMCNAVQSISNRKRACHRDVRSAIEEFQRLGLIRTATQGESYVAA